jgi:hypothetical protein
LGEDIERGREDKWGKRWVLGENRKQASAGRKTDNKNKRTSFKHEVVKELGAS